MSSVAAPPSTDSKPDGFGTYLVIMCCFVATANSATQGYDSSMMASAEMPSSFSKT